MHYQTLPEDHWNQQIKLDSIFHKCLKTRETNLFLYLRFWRYIRPSSAKRISWVQGQHSLYSPGLQDRQNYKDRSSLNNTTRKYFRINLSIVKIGIGATRNPCRFYHWYHYCLDGSANASIALMILTSPAIFLQRLSCEVTQAPTKSLHASP